MERNTRNMVWIALILLVPYGWIMLHSARSLMKMNPFRIAGRPPLKISVVIAVRNEQRNIAGCLKSLLQQDFPAGQMEILIMDDHSSDQTAAIVNGMQDERIQYHRLSIEEQGKKAAINKGIGLAKYEFILTTDADCRFNPNWMRTMAAFQLKYKSVFIAAPVVMDKEQSFLDKFQSLDFLTLQGITAVAVTKQWFNMANGANLMYSRKAFEDVNGFEGIDAIPTGDDMLLMEKMSNTFPDKVHYCFSPDVVVVTEPEKSWKSFLHQRIRWASKSTLYQNRSIKWVLGLVYALNLILLAVMIGVAFGWMSAWALLLVVVKGMIEYPFMQQITTFFRKTNLLIWFFPMQPIHIAYTVIAATLGWVGQYEWKGRKIKTIPI